MPPILHHQQPSWSPENKQCQQRVVALQLVLTYIGPIYQPAITGYKLSAFGEFDSIIAHKNYSPHQYIWSPPCAYHIWLHTHSQFIAIIKGSILAVGPASQQPCMLVIRPWQNEVWLPQFRKQLVMWERGRVLFLDINSACHNTWSHSGGQCIQSGLA